MRIGIVILTLNAGEGFAELLGNINRAANICFCRKIVMDSQSSDDTVDVAAVNGFQVINVNRREFNHGGTRQRAAEILREDVDVIMFLTQDVVVSDKNCFSVLAQSFADETVGMAYGRQLPHENASPLAVLLRKFNYPAESCRKTLADKERLGLKTAFASDTFAAYRTSALFAVGGFPPSANCSEDMYVAGKMLINGYAVLYNADAAVRHSHEFNLKTAWARYKAVGEFHAQEKWLAETFGKAEGEGLKLLKMQLDCAVKTGGMKLAARIILDDALKFAAYRAGKLSKGRFFCI